MLKAPLQPPGPSEKAQTVGSRSGPPDWCSGDLSHKALSFLSRLIPIAGRVPQNRPNRYGA